MTHSLSMEPCCIWVYIVLRLERDPQSQKIQGRWRHSGVPIIPVPISSDGYRIIPTLSAELPWVSKSNPRLIMS